MTRWRVSVAVLASSVLVAGCGGHPDDAGPPPSPPVETSADPDGRDAADPVDAAGSVDLVMGWAQQATHAARNGPSVLVRFTVGSRAPGVAADADCVPPFAGALRAAPDALADPVVTRRPDGSYRVRGADLGVDVAVTDGRAGHLEGCGGPESLLVEAEEERLAAIAAAEAAAARQAAAEAAEEAAAREAEEQARLAAERDARAQADAEAATRDGLSDDGSDVPERVEVFPNDRTARVTG